MSATIPRCDRCNLDRVFVHIAPFNSAQNYGVEWRCPHCDDHVLDICPLGPLVPTDQTCLNCGVAFAGTGDFSACPACSWSRLGARDTLGVDPLPKDPIAVAGNLFDVGLIRRALATVNFALIVDPMLEQAWHVKYSFLSGIGFWEAALTVIDAAAQRINDPELIISRGYALQTLRRHTDAIAAYRTYLEKTPNGDSAGVALCGIANLFHTLGDDAAADAHFQRAIEKDPRQPSHYADYGRYLFAKKRYDEAHTIVDRGWECAKDTAVVQQLLLDKALLFAEQLKGEQSLQCVDAAIAQGADSSRAHYLRGRALALLGDRAQARQCMQRVLKIDPNNADARRGIQLIDEARK